MLIARREGESESRGQDFSDRVLFTLHSRENIPTAGNAHRARLYLVKRPRIRPRRRLTSRKLRDYGMKLSIRYPQPLFGAPLNAERDSEVLFIVAFLGFPFRLSYLKQNEENEEKGGKERKKMSTNRLCSNQIRSSVLDLNRIRFKRGSQLAAALAR